MKMKKLVVLLALAALSTIVITGCSGGQKETATANTTPETTAEITAKRIDSKTTAIEGAMAKENTAEEDKENYDTGDVSLDNTRNQDEIGENEFLVVGFGTSYNNSRCLIVGAVEDAIEKAFPDYFVKRGFTSRIIINRVKSRGQVSTDNVGEALDRVVDNKVKNLVIQSTHLMSGSEYTNLANEVTECSDAFEKIAVGELLLTTGDDSKAAVKAITGVTAECDDGEAAICLMSHDIEVESNQVYSKMRDVLADTGYNNYYMGTVKISPTIEDVLAAAQAGGHKKVVLEPLMIVTGDRVSDDMTGDEEGPWKKTFKDARYEVTCLVHGFREMEAVQQPFVEHTKVTAGSLSKRIKRKNGRSGEFAGRLSEGGTRTSPYRDSLCKTYLRKASLHRTRLAVVMLAMGPMVANCGGIVSPDNFGGAVTGAPGTMGSVKEPEENGESMEIGKPIETEKAKKSKEADHESESVYDDELRDGVYPVAMESSSSILRITEYELTARDGSISAVMTMGGTGYLKLHMGTGEETQEASGQDSIPYVETKDGVHTFIVSVAALDQEIDYSAFSENKEKWYDRVLVFRFQSLSLDAFTDSKMTTVESLKLEDGSYIVKAKLEGGSGRAVVEFPAVLRVEDRKTLVTIIWGSSNYDYIKVDGEKFELISTEGNSALEIPVNSSDWKIPVIADTVTMSQLHEISCTLVFDSSILKRVE